MRGCSKAERRKFKFVVVRIAIKKL